jgi:dTDP-glucose 4,6-dehydratase
MDLSTPINDTTAKLIGPITFIINYASESEAHDSRSLIRNNVNVVLHLLEFARVVNPEAVLLISTDEVYGPARPGYEHKEWDPIVPNSPYSASKAAQEAIAISYWRTFRVPIVLVNADYLIGENQDPTKSVPSLISSIAQEQEVRIHGDLIGSRSYLHARHLGDAILFLLNRGKFRRFCPVEHVMEPDRWNVTGGKELTHLELAQLIANLLGKPLKYKPVGSGSVLHRYALDGTKIMETGWRAPINFEESLLPMIEWTLGHGSWKKGV